MLAFIALVGNDGEPLDPTLIDRLERSAPTMLPFVPDWAMYWLAPSATICVLGWEAFTEQAGMGAHWHERADGGLTAFSGHCWPAGAGWPHDSTSWAVQLDAWLGERDPATARDGLFGHFDLIRLDAQGRGAIVPDFLNCGPLYTAQAAGCQVVSNRAGLAALVATPEGAKPVRSPMGAGWLVFNALMFDDETGYVAVDHLPHGASVRIDPNRGVRIERGARSTLETQQRDDPPSTYADLVPLMVEDVRAHLRFVSQLPVDSIELRLSGGKDSRILAAGVVATGLQDRIGLMTFGPPDKSDPLVAAAVARAFDLRWRLDDRRGRPARDDLAMVATHTFLTEGTVSGWNTTADLFAHNDVTLTGVGGDFIGWRYESTAGLAASNRAEALAQMTGRDDFDRFDLLQNDARTWYMDEIGAWVDERIDMGVDPSLVRSLFLREGKMRGQTGPARAVESSLWFDSFCSPLWMRASFQLPPAERPGFRFHIDVIDQLCPGMLDIPLANKVWTPESYAHRADQQRFRGLEAVVGSGGAALNWRVVGWPQYRPVLAEMLLERGNPLYQVLDYRRVEQLMQREKITAAQARVLYGALTAAIWLGETEDRRPISRRLPATAGTPAA